MFPLEFKFKYQKKRSATEERLFLCKDRLFVAIHWLTVILITSASFFTGISQTDVDSWNMTLHCEEERFNQPMTPIDRKWSMITVVIVSIIVVFLMSIKMCVCGATSKDFIDIMNYFLGLLLSWDVIYVLQSLISYPIPSFFQNEQLKWFYCCKSCPPPKLTKHLHKLDLESRGSFPSFLPCATAYAAVFLFLLTCRLDEGRRFAAKLLALLVPGSVSLIYSWYLWENNENHLHDVVAGAVIGILLAIYIIKDIFPGDNKLDRFADNFISVLMAREIEMAQLTRENSTRGGGDGGNEYTINLYSHDTSCMSASADLEDRPPPYSSL